MAGAIEAMQALAAAAVLADPAAFAQVISATTVSSVGGANALSTPSARHLVRMEAGSYLLALQKDGAVPDTGLNLYRSDDDGGSWSFYAAINGNAADRHTADLVKVGDDLAMVTSFDGPSIVPDAKLDPNRKVLFQWWRSNRAGDWSPEPRVAVFNPAAGAAYHRGELAIDSAGRIWVQAFKRGSSACDPATDPTCKICDTVANGDNYPNELVVSVSTDGGRTFSSEQSLATTACRAGGRLISAGTKLLLLWNDYSGNENGTRMVTRFALRDAADPLGAWSAPTPAFPDEPADGIYHGAAMSAAADAAGVHVVYKDQNQQRLWYRRFDLATASFGPRVQVDDSEQDWALQPATTLRAGELFVFANHRLAEGRYETRMWRQSLGFGSARAVALPAEDAFHGYPTLPETLTAAVRTMPYLYARAATATGAAEEMALRIALDRPNAVLALEEGRALLPAGRSVAVRVQTGSIAGVTDPVQLGVSGLPAGVHGDFAPAVVLPGGFSMLTLAADASAPAGSNTCTLALTAGPRASAVPFHLEVFAAPTVSFRGPEAGAVLHGMAGVQATADASPGLKVSAIELLVDGEPVAVGEGSAASFTWDTSRTPDGAHDLAARAVDGIGNSTVSAPVRVSVRNGGGGGCASAGSEQPVLALAIALAALLLRRRRRVS